MAFVPTMGALHAGHLALVHEARGQADAVAVSIFVNPLQFNRPDDLANYPRSPQEDERLLREAGADLLLMPTADTLFNGFTPRQYDLGGLDRILEGASRPGHFQGVVNVVERLFHYVRPDVAVFGEKDRQQLAVIRHAASTLRWPERILGHPTLRDADGLALSSRNLRLAPPERRLAPQLHRALREVEACAFTSTVQEAVEAGRHWIARFPAIRLDYLALVHAATLQDLASWDGVQEAVVLIAAQVGPVRLIDNIPISR